MKSYSIDEKIKILKCLDQPGMDRKSVREKYGLSESTLRGFIKNKAQLIENFKSSSVESVKRKRNREGAFPGLERAVTLWISSKNVQGSLPSAEMILTTAKMLSTQMGLDFEPSESWVRRMKKRNNIS